jgi:hypothetical protein
MSEIVHEFKSVHLFVNKSIMLTNNIYMLTLDMTKNSYYTLKKLCASNTAPSHGMIKIYNPDNINLNNSELMCTLNYSPKYNNFTIKSLTVVDKIYKSNKNSRNGVSFNKRIVNNILNIPL